MNYHIDVSFGSKGDRTRIASFIEKQDRNICLEAFVEYWGEECQFFAEDEEW